MINNFTLKGNKIVLKNTGEYFGALGDFEYNIGDKLYEFAIMSHQDFDKLKAIYNQLIGLVCYAKETVSEYEKYYPDEFYKDLEEDEYTPEILIIKWNEGIEKVSNKKHNEYMKFFETIRDLLIENLIEKKADLKERLELISKYSNNSFVRNLSVPEKLFLYETKRVFDLHYFNTKPAHALFLDTKFKIKVVDISSFCFISC